MTWTDDNYLLRVKRDGDTWIVSEDGSALYGAGRSLLEAMTDFWHAALELPDVIERNTPCSPALERAADIARRLTEADRG
jgi:hypothetical protein